MGVRGSLGAVVALAGLAFVAGAAGARAQLPPASAPARPPLRDVPLGSAVRLSALRGDARYRDTFLREFASLTPENELKLDALQPRRGRYDFAAADELVRFARQHGKTVRGHTLIWGQALPLWLVDHGATDRLGLRLPPISLDGIGLQMHTHIAGAPDQAALENTMRRFTDLGLEVQITEMDVGTSLLDVSRAVRLQQQALAYGAAARACNAVTACTRFTTWGFTDAVSWLSAGESGLLLDRRYREKPAYAALHSAFATGPVVRSQSRQPTR